MPRVKRYKVHVQRGFPPGLAAWSTRKNVESCHLPVERESVFITYLLPCRSTLFL